jgi:hypothetical protein
VTGRHVRPLLLLQKRRGVLCEANTKYILHNTKVSKCFPGSWKMENRKQAKEDIMLSHLSIACLCNDYGEEAQIKIV